jgi:hypothetical protein
MSGPCGWRSISRPHKGRRSPLYGFLRDRPIILYGLAPTLICMALGLSWLSGTCFAVAVSRSFCRACQSIAAACSVDPHCDSRESVIWTSRPLKAVIPAGGFPGFINPNPPAIGCRTQPAAVSALPIDSIRSTDSGSRLTEKSNGVPANCFTSFVTRVSFIERGWSASHSSPTPASTRTEKITASPFSRTFLDTLTTTIATSPLNPMSKSNDPTSFTKLGGTRDRNAFSIAGLPLSAQPIRNHIPN